MSFRLRELADIAEAIAAAMDLAGEFYRERRQQDRQWQPQDTRDVPQGQGPLPGQGTFNEFSE
jgi:hypothetical protein